jgi:hypothetical protein
VLEVYDLAKPDECEQWEEEVLALIKKLKRWFLSNRKETRQRLIRLVNIGSQYYEHAKKSLQDPERVLELVRLGEDSLL